MMRVVKILSLAVTICFLISTAALAETFDVFANHGDVTRPVAVSHINFPLESQFVALHSGSRFYSQETHGLIFTEGSPFSGSFNRLLPCMAANNSVCSTWRITRFPHADIIPVVVATPEPGMLVLFGTGLIGLGGLVRKRFAR